MTKKYFGTKTNPAENTFNIRYVYDSMT